MTARLLLVVSLLCLRWLAAYGQADFSDELPRIPPLEPSEALRSFEVADGFTMQLVAAEPLVSTPVAMEWAADGSLFVCEMRGYSEDRDAGISRISRLVDVDQDGSFDQRTTFADGLMWPTGLMPYDGGLFVGDAPHLYYLKDVDGDGEADEERIVLTGFGTSNVQGLMNSFRWGLDNRVHIACSSVGGSIRRPDQSESEAVNIRGRDIALDPRTGEFIVTSGAAQHGMCFDDWGRKFVSSNSNHLQQVMYEDRYVARNPYVKMPPSRISIASDGPQAEVFRASPVEPWRIVRTRLRVGGLVPGPIEGGGRAAGYFTGATGVTIYRGDAWPEEFRGYAIIGDVGSNLIHRKVLVPDELQMIGRRVDPQSEFVRSNDIWFRPAQFANAPDGTLYVIDVCREVIEHPKSLPPDIKKHLDLTSGRDRGRIYRIAPDGFRYRPTPNLKNASVEDLVEALQHDNAWHRETASRRIYELDDSEAVDPLRELALRSPHPLGRLHAMYALDGLNALDESVILAGLADIEARVRVAAVRLSERSSTSHALRSKLQDLHSDPSIHVRYQLAFTIGSIQEIDPTRTLAAIIQQDPGNRWIQAAVQSSSVDHAGRLFATLVRETSDRSFEMAEVLSELARQISQQESEASFREAIAAVESIPATDAIFALPIIGQLLGGSDRKSGMYRKLAAAGELEKAETARDRMIESLVARSGDASQSTQHRVLATERLAYGKLGQVADALTQLIDHPQPIAVQKAAIQTLGSFPSTEIVNPLLEQWAQLSPSLRSTALDVLFERNDRVLRLFDAVDRGDLSATDLPSARLQIARTSKDPNVRHRVAKYLENVGANVERDALLQTYRKALDLRGDPDQGSKHFKQHCANCHKLGDVGHELGPNLATIQSRGPETILVNVLDPNREVNPEYLNYVVLTLDGRTLSGMIASESATTLTLKRAESATDEVLRRDIEVLKSTGMSLMPEGFEKHLDVQAMADLIAFLMAR